MSLPATVENLLNPKVDGDSNMLVFKNRGVFFQKNQNILQSLAFTQTFEEISEWVITHSKGLKFIANPSIASDTDRLDCLFAVQEPLVLALKNVEKRRKNGRDKLLIKAVKVDNYALIADILASAAATYWRNHGFFNSEKDLKTTAYLKNDEINQQKKVFRKAQLEYIGAAVDFQKAEKKGAFQEILDFFETEEILRNIDFED